MSLRPVGRPGGLGRGLAALIPDEVRHTSAPGGPTLLRVPLDQVVPNPEQPRRHLDPVDLESLAASIKEHGLLQPVLVREEAGRYVLLAGERRWRAAGRAGLVEIPVLVTERADAPRDQLLLALVENLQRADLDPVEEALGYQRLSELYDLTHEAIATRVGKDRSTVTNALRLLKLPPDTLEALAEHRITAGHAKALLGLRDPAKTARVLAEILERDLSVRATERLVAFTNGPGPGQRAHAPVSAWRPVETLLTRSLNSRVQIKDRADGGGKVVINYASREELTALVERLRGGA